MLRAILFDLDNVLLENPLQQFSQEWIAGLARYMASEVHPEAFTPALIAAVQAMDTNTGGGVTNAEIFRFTLHDKLGRPQGELDELFARFFLEEFPKLRKLTRTVPGARTVVEWAFQHRLQVAIATGMQTPHALVEERLLWAGLPATDFNYTLLTTWDNMHASKPNPVYYLEVLDQLGRGPGECLMVGDDWEHDIAPAMSVGIPSFWVTPAGHPHPADQKRLVGQGSLAELLSWLEQTGGEEN